MSMSSCDSKTGVCETPAANPMPHQSCEAKCSCGGVCGGDPVVCTMIASKKAFHEAKEELMKDIFKAKIQKVWGAKMEKVADAVIAAMEVKKESMMSMGKAKEELRTKIENIIKGS
ncbi:MAG: hypothetical protein HQL24_05515 [Candidatus Omnitrophica bacterium]|nr:hypothetical protein [Candidatus Omnitrophota bacterium]